MIKARLIILFALLYLQTEAQILIGKELVAIRNVSKTDSTISLLTKSAQFEDALIVKIDSVYFECVLDGKERIKFISTSDEAFKTSESLKVNDRFSTLKRMSNLNEFIVMPGWGKYVKLESGWNAVFDFRKKIKNKSKIVFFFQRVD